MSDEDAEFYAAFSLYLSAGDATEQSALPLDIAHAAGRQAATNGYSKRLNPFDPRTEGAHYSAWVVGYESKN